MKELVLAGGALRCIRYPGYQRYYMDLHTQFKLDKLFTMPNPFIARSEDHDALELLVWETPEKTQTGFLWSPVQVGIKRE